MGEFKLTDMTWKLDSVAITNYVYNTPFQQQTDIVNRVEKRVSKLKSGKKKKTKSVGILGQKAWVFGLRAVPLVSSHPAPTCTMFLTSLPSLPDGKDADYQFSG